MFLSFQIRLLIKRTQHPVKLIIAILSENPSVVTRSDSRGGQHYERTKTPHESVFVETYPQDDINDCLKQPLASHTLLCRKNDSKDRDEKKNITNWSAGGHLQPRAKKRTTHIVRSPGNCSSKGPAALSHYFALPQRSDGGWDGAEPHTGHRGCNKSQMCWGDMKIHGQAPL